VDEDLGNPSKLDLSITTDNEHHDKDKSEAMSQQESCEEVIESTILDFDDAILFVENESFSCGLISMKVLMRISVLNMNLFLLTPSKLTSSLNLASLNLSSLIILSS